MKVTNIRRRTREEIMTVFKIEKEFEKDEDVKELKELLSVQNNLHLSEGENNINNRKFSLEFKGNYTNEWWEVRDEHNNLVMTSI